MCGRNAALIAAMLIGSCAAAYGQTSGNWILNGDGNWSDPLNWSPAIPGGGGVATFSQLPRHDGVHNVTLDVPVTLSEMRFTSPVQWIIPDLGTNEITLVGPAIIEVPISNASTPSGSPSGYGEGDRIMRPIVGSSGLTKTGPGTLTLTAQNTYTGGTTINGGVLQVQGMFQLGDVSGAVTLNGGTLRIVGGSPAIPHNVVLGAGHGTIQTTGAGSFGAATFLSAIDGIGSFNKTGASNLTMRAVNTYTGETNFQHRGTLEQNVFVPTITNAPTSGTILYNFDGSCPNTSAILSGGTIELNNRLGPNLNHRLPSVPTALYGAGVTLVSESFTVTSIEELGPITQSGESYFTVGLSPGATQSGRMTLASVSRLDRGTQAFRGTNLGNTPGANVGNIFIDSPPALIGGGGAAGSTNISIIPAALAGTNITNVARDLATYGPTGVRPLSDAAGEYAFLATAGPTDNVRTPAATATSGDKTVNALVIGLGALTGSDTLTLTSGMLVVQAAATHTANFNFGTVEGLVMTPSGCFLAGSFSGSGGLTKSGGGTATFTGNSTYTGVTTVVAGNFNFSSNVPRNAPSPFGSSADPIVIAPGSSPVRVLTTLDGTVFDRDIIARGLGTATAGFGVTNGRSMTMNGSIALERQLNIEGSFNKVVTFNGNISGTGRLSDSPNSTIVINGNNTEWSGGMEIMQGTAAWFAGNDRAFGTGPIWFGTVGTIGAASAARTIANPIALNGSMNIGSTSLVSGHDITFTGPVDLGGSHRLNEPILHTISVPANLTATFTGEIANGGLLKEDAGVLVLAGANTYAAGTVVNAGVLRVDNVSGSGTGTNFVTVNAATLAGRGTIAGPVTIASTGLLSPGDSAGTLTSGPLALSADTGLLWDLDTPGVVGAGVNDLMVVNGDLLLDGILTVAPGLNFGPGVYTLFTYTGELTDAGLMVDAVAGGRVDLSVPGEVRLMVPEPACGVLTLGAVAGASCRRKRRKC